MTQSERRVYLISELLKEQPDISLKDIPLDEENQRSILRALMNIRPPKAADRTFLNVQNAYLKEEIRRKGITYADNLIPMRENLYLWQGDITTLRCGAIVNAANSSLLGCFIPGHHCIDNAIHTFSGVQLRLACAELIAEQGHKEYPGGAKITPAFNLPSSYVIHTVGPVISGAINSNNKKQLASCYRSCLNIADENGISSIAFCCISTGEFHFPNDAAAEISVNTVKDYLKVTNSRIKVIFNVFKNCDYEIYRKLLGRSQNS